MDPSNPTALLQKQARQFQTPLAPIWCAGCGDFGALQAIQLALVELKKRPEEVVIVSGIGCSGRLPGYVASYGFNGLHGRALPLATGLKLARPELTVLVVSGDGDAYSIGAAHLLHAARRNVDLTYLVLDNAVYGLTRGHASPTTPEGNLTPSSPHGVQEPPTDPLELGLAAGVSFLARAAAGNIRHLADVIVAAVRHPGFALINCNSPCTTYRGSSDYELYKERGVYLTEKNHDATRKESARAEIASNERIGLGVLYRELRPTLEARLARLRPARSDGAVADGGAPAKRVDELLD